MILIFPWISPGDCGDEVEDVLDDDDDGGGTLRGGGMFGLERLLGNSDLISDLNNKVTGFIF